jgi:hypothetical protein
MNQKSNVDLALQVFDWQQYANCKIAGQRLNSDMFEPLHREMSVVEQKRAKQYCDNCPVFDRCYRWCLESIPDPLPYAFAAGMTSRQRQKHRHDLIADPMICTCRRCQYFRRKRNKGER